MLPLKPLLVSVISLMLITACTTTPVQNTGTFGQKVSKPKNTTGNDSNNKIYLGKWTLVKVVYPNGESKDFSDQPANYIHITENEISENMPGYGKKTYNYLEKDNTLIIMAGNRLSTWKIVKNSQREMEIETAAGRYVLVR